MNNSPLDEGTRRDPQGDVDQILKLVDEAVKSSEELDALVIVVCNAVRAAPLKVLRRFTSRGDSVDHIVALVWEKLAARDDPIPSAAYFWAVVLNVIRGALKKEERVSSRFVCGVEFDLLPGSTDHRLQGQDRIRIREIVEQLLARLTDKEREVVELRVLEGESFRAIAKTLRIKEATARRRYSRAIQKLRAWAPPSLRQLLG